MKIRHTTSSGQDKIELQMTSRIDIVFQLVLFFMVSTTFITTPGLEVELPRSASESLVSETHEIDVWIGEQSINGCLHASKREIRKQSLIGRKTNVELWTRKI